MTKASNRLSTMRAGVGKVDMTLSAEGVWGDVLSEAVQKHIPPDYLRKHIEVSDPVFVRALVLDDGSRELVLVTMDVTAIGARTISQNILGDSADDFMPRLRARIENEIGIPGRNVSVFASHTHQTPRMLCDDEAQLTRAVEAIRRARRNMAGVSLGFGSGADPTLTFNRTMRMKDGSDYTIRSYYAPVPPDDDVLGLRPVDPEIGILRIDRLDGSPMALVYHFATHLLLGAPDGKTGTITADHVGVTQRFLEERIGGGVMAFFLQGALGDVVEANQFDTQHPCTAKEFGTRLGQSVWNAYRRTSTGAAALRVASRTVELPLRTDIPLHVEKLREEQSQFIASLRYTSLNFKAFLPLYLQYALSPEFPSHWAFRYQHAADIGDTGRAVMDERNRGAIQKYLDGIHAMECLADREEKIATLTKHHQIIQSLGKPTVPAEFQGIRIGDGVFLTAPMEILAETGLQIKKQSPFDRTYVTSLANGYLHYAPPASYYEHGGYEVTECLLAPAWETIFHDTVADIFGELKISRQ